MLQVADFMREDGDQFFIILTGRYQFVCHYYDARGKGEGIGTDVRAGTKQQLIGITCRQGRGHFCKAPDQACLCSLIQR